MIFFLWFGNPQASAPITSETSSAKISTGFKGAQYRYDARNVEALAAQVALQTWRTLLLGQKFEIYSDHDSLQYLFTQKSPCCQLLMGGKSQFYESIAFGMWTYFTLFAVVLALV